MPNQLYNQREGFQLRGDVFGDDLQSPARGVALAGSQYGNLVDLTVSANVSDYNGGVFLLNSTGVGRVFTIGAPRTRGRRFKFILNSTIADGVEAKVRSNAANISGGATRRGSAGGVVFSDQRQVSFKGNASANTTANRGSDLTFYDTGSAWVVSGHSGGTDPFDSSATAS